MHFPLEDFIKAHMRALNERYPRKYHIRSWNACNKNKATVAQREALLLGHKILNEKRYRNGKDDT